MFDSATLLLFVTTSLLLLVTPGPAVLYIVAQSVSQGRQAGIVSAFGVGLGSLVHVIAAAVGLSALLVSSALAFSIVKYLGAAYLIYLGLRTLLARDDAHTVAIAEPERLARVFRQGVIVNVLNPKLALFFFAFLPQFVDPAQGSVALQSLILGGLFIVMGVFSDTVYAVTAAAIRGWLTRSRRVMRAQRYFSGLVYIGLGVTTAFSGSSSQK